MREIKFRGKDKENKNWVYGFAIIVQDTAIICSWNAETENLVYNFVVPETVGQYTGVKDKDGTEIYEGDIISVSEDKKNGEVIYNSAHCGYIVTGKAWACGCARLGQLCTLFIRVIGNAHKNPELLEVV